MDSDFNSIACEYQFLGPVRIKLEEFENGGFTLKKHQLYAVRRNLNMQQSTVFWNLCFRKTRSGKSHGYRYIVSPSFSKGSIFKMKMYSRRFQIPPVSGAFPKRSIFVTD